MQVKLKKNFKYFIFILLICFCFVFKISTANALVFKGSDYNNSFQVKDKSGTLTNNSNNWVQFDWTTSIFKSDYENVDLIGLKINALNITKDYNLSTGANVCDTYRIDHYYPGSGGTSNMIYNQLVCTNHSSSSSSNLIEGDVTISAYIYPPSGSGDPCWFDDTMQGYLICPLNKPEINHFSFVIRTNGFDNASYNISLADMKILYTYESTEIVNGLSGVQQQQINTTTSITNFNNYVANTDTTDAEANQSTALGSISNTFNTHMSKANELTQFFLIPINFMVNISNNTCKPLVWDIPFVNTRVQIPCMSTIYNSYFSTFISVFSLIMTSLLGYRSMLKLFNAIKGMVDAEDDKVEVVDL